METIQRTDQPHEVEPHPTTPDMRSPSRDEMWDDFVSSFEIESGDEVDGDHWYDRRKPADGGGGGVPKAPDESPEASGTSSSSSTSPLTRYLIQNRTPYLIRIPHDEHPEYGELVIPPLANRVVAGSRLRPFAELLRPYRQRHEVCVRPYERERRSAGSWVLLLAIVGVVAMLGFHFLYEGTIKRWEFLAVVVAAAAVWAVVLIAASIVEERRRRRARNSDSDEGDIAAGMGGAFVDGNETSRRAMSMLVLLLVITIGALLPSMTILLATDAYGMVNFEGGFEVHRDELSQFTSRVIQMVYVSVLSLFPALMYFQFDRQRVGTIWGHWVRAIFRMDSRMRTMADVHARYGDDLMEASNNSAKSVRYLGGNHSPIVVSTILIALGWTVLVLQTESFDFTSVSQARQLAEAADDASQRAQVAAETVAAAENDSDRQAALVVSEQALDAATSANAAAQALADQEVADDAADAGIELPAREPDDSEVTAGADGDATRGGEGGASAEGEGQPTEPGERATQEDVTGAATADDVIAEAEANAEQAAREAEQANAALDKVRSTSYFQLLAPRPSAAAMAFLGAYFFAVYLVLRSYFRGDLRPKLYNQITARLVTVVVIAYLINVLFFDSGQQRALWVVAFVAGIVPRTITQRIMILGDRAAGLVMKNAISAGRPLTQIDGVDLYDRSVLEAEGIPDVPALANSDLASTMVRTRLPAGRLVDWADQATMMTVLNCDDKSKLSKAVVKKRKDGIRTASQYIAACSCGAWDALGDDGRCAASVVADAADDGSADDRHVPAACPKCVAMIAQGAWPKIHGWRTSKLGEVKDWIPLEPLPASPVGATPGSGSRPVGSNGS